MQSLTHHVCHHSNVVVYAEHGQWWLSRALGPPKKLVEQEGGQHTRLHNGNEWLMHNTEVVFVEDYENTTPWAERARHVLDARAGGVPVVDALPTVARVATRETSFSIRPTSNEMCTHFKWEAHEGEGDWKCAQGKCTKRHRSVYKLEALKSLLHQSGFALSNDGAVVCFRLIRQEHLRTASISSIFVRS